MRALRSLVPLVCVALLGGMVGCFNVTEPTCSLRCSPHKECPDDYVCHLDDGLCHLVGTPDGAVCPNAMTTDAGPSTVDSGGDGGDGGDGAVGDGAAPDLLATGDLAMPDAAAADASMGDAATTNDLSTVDAPASTADLTVVPDLLMLGDLAVVPDLGVATDLM